LRISWAIIFWLAYLFFLMVLFWWWEFRLLELLKQWSLWNHFLVICFAVVLVLQVALLIPRDWDKVDDMNEYFLAKRRWFYSVFALSLIIDLIDSYELMKTKLVLTIAVLIGGLALVAAGYCFWLMNVPLSYRWVPVVITGFLLAIFVFIISLITSFIALMQLRRSPRPPNTPQIRPRS